MNQAMKKGRCATRKNSECGLWSVPDDVLLDCLAQMSRLDLVSLATVSKRHGSFAVSHELRTMRYERGSVDPYLYVFIHMYPDPWPQWFVFHPLQRRLKRVSLDEYPAPVAGSCFVKTNLGIYTIGGLVDGKPTSEVTYLDCVKHKLYRIVPMKMARSGASASLMEKKIYVFGGCSADSSNSNSNWVDVFDMATGTWNLLSVSTPKVPLNIQLSVAIERSYFYAVDQDGELFCFTPSDSKFVAHGITDSNPENRNDWLVFDRTFFCRGIGGKILWRLPCESDWKLPCASDWKEVKGLDELQQQYSGIDIIKLSHYSIESFAIFWESRPQGPDQVLELCYAQISLTRRKEGQVWDVWGNVEWSGAVLSDSSYTGFNLLHATSVYA